jgi:hypothetical protein
MKHTVKFNNNTYKQKTQEVSITVNKLTLNTVNTRMRIIACSNCQTWSYMVKMYFDYFIFVSENL